MLFLHLINLLRKFLVLTLDVLDVSSDDNFLSVDAILVLLVEISFFAELFPGRFGIISHNFSLSKLDLHSFNFSFKARIFVLDVSNETNAKILESSFFLELKPLILENVHGFFHLEGG
jgi:hypothetical protein